MKKCFFAFFFLAALLLRVNAQQTEFSGTITDDTGAPLSGVNVMVKGSSTGTVSDNNGAFKIKTASKGIPILTFSHSGYQSKEQLAAGGTLRVVLEKAIKGEDEIVIIGYGSVKKKDLTTSISTLNEQDIMKTPITSLEQALQGNAAGVHVVNTSAEPGGEISIRVRGGSSIKADNEPLLVVDGFTTDQGLASLNPSDIKSIEVLKDAGATAIYGSRGANGVIMVTTKSGSRGKPVVRFETYYGTQHLRRKLPLLNAAQLATLANEGRVAAGQSPITNQPDTMQTTRDWQSLMFHEAPQLSNTVSVAGGDDRVKYYVSASYLRQSGLIINSNYSRAALRSNIDFNFNKQVSAGVKLNLSQTIKNGIQVGDNGSILRANSTNPTDKGLLDPSGSFYVDPETGDPVSTSPLANAQETTNEKRNFNAQVSGFVQVRFLKNFTFRSNATISPTFRIDNYYFPNSIKGDKVSDGYQQYDGYNKWSNDNSVNYTKLVKKHTITALLGEEATGSFRNNFRARNTDFATDVFLFYNLGGGSGVPSVNSSAEEYQLLSYFGRATYGYDNRYLFSFTYRADGSSKFGANNRWGYFPSASAAWRINNERFMQQQSLFSDLKLRMSYGVNGSDRISAYSSQALYSTRATAIGGVVGIGYMIDRMANEDLRWEKTAEYNAGLDMAFLKSRISITADYYYKKTTDLLLDFALPAASGYTTVAKNVGSVENKGWEFSITSRNIIGKFNWTTTFNASINRNKVLDLGGPEEISAISNSSANTKFGNVILMKVGQPLGVFFGHRTNGIYQTAEEAANGPVLQGLANMPGFLRYVDQNGDNKITDADKVILGNPQPKWSGGMTNMINYKNVDFTAFIVFQQGNAIMNTGIAKLLNLTGDNNQLAKALDRWRPANPENNDPGNPSNTIPRAYRNYPAIMSDFYIEDGSYLRLKTISLGYTINNKRISRIKVPNTRIYASVTNLLTFTSYYSGYDPEVSIMGKQGIGAGIDNGSYPTSKMYLVGLNMTL
ncbi:TonB-dependent receptor [Niabella sp.]|uniref:SusC/RagA family TonB-linked outer membrane protein n=1 Tax=Niabella sp. TaxID=1962976 RepID=UPI0026226E88|nr:TonB-dependent receptor [Niabella sp.]